MISVDFSQAIAVYILVVLSVISALWLAHKKEKNRDLTLDDRFIWHCGVCTYTYINTKEDLISICPRCGSYNKKVVDMRAG